MTDMRVNALEARIPAYALPVYRGYVTKLDKLPTEGRIAVMEMLLDLIDAVWREACRSAREA